MRGVMQSNVIQAWQVVTGYPVDTGVKALPRKTAVAEKSGWAPNLAMEAG